MNTRDTKGMEMMTNNNLTVITGIRYMDDIRAFLHAIRAGCRLWEGRLCYCEEWRMEDLKDGKSATRRTAEILLAIMNQVMPFLKFMMEIGEDFIDLKLPTLLRKDHGHQHRPPTKFASLAQEVVRRLLHTSRTLPSPHRMENLEKFCQKMTNSRHNKIYIRKVIISGIEKYTKKNQRSIPPSSHKDYKPLPLGTNFNTLGRWRDKMLEKTRTRSEGWKGRIQWRKKGS